MSVPTTSDPNSCLAEPDAVMARLAELANAFYVSGTTRWSACVESTL